MPRHEKAMKDVVSCEKLRVGASDLRPGDIRMGQPGAGNAASLFAECIGRVERTQGTETSKYLQEEKSTEIPSVAASERGRAQTMHLFGVWGCGICHQRYRRHSGMHLERCDHRR